MSWLTDIDIWASFFTLTALEMVLGIDNIIFISIVTGQLEERVQKRAQTIGLMLAAITRLLLLGLIFFLAQLDSALFTAFGEPISIRDLVLIGGGLFLLAKSTMEIHDDFEGHQAKERKHAASFKMAIVQIIALDMVFSIDSVITAIGMADQVAVMAAAIVVAIGFMLMYANAVSNFVNRHPTLKMLALAFLILIGVTLIAEGLGLHVPKGYIYFSMAFAFAVEMLNLRRRKQSS
ncbi:TerC family protein [Dyella sp.]|uniref:TerC family protein n=1 Tax=Dyella sp. TaxID=1869338 RepID=UPI002D76A3D9|nr:TerC family protein [Dyella sp.]HET7333110.1 TerC family protein [Dyella sp.]HET7371028.1 TerC family protein [Gammaproteobacteria bacterium]